MNKTVAAYAAWSESYDSAPNATRDADREVMHGLASRFADLDLLEFGCGTGKNTETFARMTRAASAESVRATA